jgi:hypothetical protein
MELKIVFPLSGQQLVVLHLLQLLLLSFAKL